MADDAMRVKATALAAILVSLFISTPLIKKAFAICMRREAEGSAPELVGPAVRPLFNAANRQNLLDGDLAGACHATKYKSKHHQGCAY
ncbi:MAG: hypothetical protein DRQ59_07505 [Gammaproteobacteria bacterium]|jgi:hypothetical protein|nr:MAG: hypothetical protein DRQ59_07505 [Gammaproteobacteria bacterium]